MNLKERLLFYLIPLTILPLVFITVVAFFLVQKIADPSLSQPYVNDALIFIGLVSLSSIIIVVSISNSLSHPLRVLTVETRKIAEGNLETTMQLEEGTKELDQLTESIEKMKSELKRQQAVIREEAAHAAIGKLASHVAHDLASPLSSFQAAMEYFKDVKTVDAKTPDYVNLLQLSSTRLKSIAKDLLDQCKGKEPKKILFSLHRILDELVGEYKTQREFDGVEFIKQYHPQSIFLFGDRAKIQRAFGNLIKNAIEAMDKFGTLTLATKINKDSSVVEIQDTGPGMTPELLQKVLGGGVSHGKKEGHGIGVQVVKATVMEHGGKVSANSEIGIGTTFCVELSLPDSAQFKGADREEDIVEEFEMRVNGSEPVVVIDDDLSMLEQWRLALERHRRTALLCSSYEDFISQNLSSKLSVTAVVDYHFENSELNGLQVIQKLKQQGFKNLYLCTAEYWKPSLRKEAEALGVKICPKPLPKIRLQTLPHPNPPPTRGREERGYTVLVIDDDETIRLSWEVMTTKLHIVQLYSYPNLELFLEANIDLKTIDIAFVDKNIKGSQYGGAAVVNYLKSKNVPKIVLASGENEETLREDPNFSQADFIVSEKIPKSFKEFFS